MKKFISVILSLVVGLLLSLTCFYGCSVENNQGRLNIVCTIFPEYDWVKNITANNQTVNATLLLDSGVDLHSYQPTADDIIKVSTCDMFIYVGGESDGWVDGVLNQKKNDKMVVINLMEVLGDKVKEEELVEGMEGEGDIEDEDEVEYDEHVWLSLKNAMLIVDHITEKLIDIDKENQALYTENANKYKQQLSDLEGQYKKAIEESSTKTLVFGDRFPFRYLFDDYNLSYYAAFAGCSAESEASFQTIVFLANKVDELGLKSIIKIEGSNNKIAETIKSNTQSKNQTILTLNSLQSVTLKDANNGVTYLNVMENNLQVIKNALN